MPYTIGEVARMMNIAPSTLRYYEKEGLLSLGVRASNGQRTYTDDDIATLSIIEYLKFCGLPLKEIRSFLPLIQPGQLLRQEIERGQVLTRLKAGKQNVEIPVVLYLPFHLGTRGGPKPLPHIQ